MPQKLKHRVQDWPCVSSNKDGLLLKVVVSPRSSRLCVVKLIEDQLKISLTSAPVDNAANKQLLGFLARVFKVKKSSLSLLRGHTSKQKIVLFEGVKKEKILSGLDELLNDA